MFSDLSPTLSPQLSTVEGRWEFQACAHLVHKSSSLFHFYEFKVPAWIQDILFQILTVSYSPVDAAQIT